MTVFKFSNDLIFLAKCYVKNLEKIVTFAQNIMENISRCIYVYFENGNGFIPQCRCENTTSLVEKTNKITFYRFVMFTRY